MNSLVLWLAQGCGLGRAPFAPGTFGSLGGVLLWLLLLSTGNVWAYAGLTAIWLLLSVWLSGQAEKLLRQTDPPSVVIDEIVAMPCCFGSWIGFFLAQYGHWPAAGEVFTARTGIVALAHFAAFRLFDIAKPWPVRQSQRLPGGWGITADDVLAAVYVNGFMMILFFAQIIRI